MIIMIYVWLMCVVETKLMKMGNWANMFNLYV